MKIDYKKFFNIWFTDDILSRISINQISRLAASSLPTEVKYDFSEVPDLPLLDLTKTLLSNLPLNFTFIKSRPLMLSTSIEHLCQEIGRQDIKFIHPYMDIEKDWYEEFKDKILFYQPNIVHEAYTLWKLSNSGVYCGAIGQFVQLADLGVVKKSGLEFHANQPNWKVYHPVSNVAYRQIVDYCNENLIYSNFVLLLARAFVKQIDINKNWINYRMLTTNKIGVTTLAISLAPFIEHNYASIINPVDYPKYPGIIDPVPTQHAVTTVDIFYE